MITVSGECWPGCWVPGQRGGAAGPHPHGGRSHRARVQTQVSTLEWEHEDILDPFFLENLQLVLLGIFLYFGFY